MPRQVNAMVRDPSGHTDFSVTDTDPEDFHLYHVIYRRK